MDTTYSTCRGAPRNPRRDLFIAAALTGHLANPARYPYGINLETMREIAENAVDIADITLAISERQTHKEEPQ